MKLYAEATTRVCTTAGDTGSIQLAAGLTQGDQLSPILFKVVMEPVNGTPSRCSLFWIPCSDEWGHYSVVTYSVDDLPLLAAGEPQ